MKKYIFIIIASLIGTLQAEIKVGNMVLWGTRYDRAAAFVDKLQSQYPEQFALLNKVAEGYKANEKEQSELSSFAEILKERMDNFELYEDLRPYFCWGAMLLILLGIIFGAHRLLRFRSA